MTLRYVLESASSDELRRPNKLFLFSPAIAVPSEAEFADWHNAISWLPGLEQFRWLEIKPEYDPYKYNSFPKNAGDQIYDLTQANWELVEQCASDSRKREAIPPIYAYQSIVDATVIPDSLTGLFAKIGNDKCDLLMFDLNRAFTSYVKSDKSMLNSLEPLNRGKFNATLYVVANRKDEVTGHFERRVTVRRYSNRNEMAKRGENVEFPDSLADSLAWPQNVFALSHGSIPISPLDSIYGASSIFENLNPRGEKDVLAIESDDLIRIRYNPFFELIKWHIEEKIKR